MRLWSLHPKYMDSQGLVALWREALLAKSVLQGQTRGYLKHPQLDRFRLQPEPRIAIRAYLHFIHAEACSRGFSFDASKVEWTGEPACAPMPVTSGQLEYEWQHLLRKLSTRNPALHNQWCAIAVPQCHPLFRVGPGAIEAWERV